MIVSFVRAIKTMVGTRAVPRHLRRTSAQAAAAVARPPEVLQ